MGIDYEPKKIAIAGDWHGNRSYSLDAIKWAAEQGVDAIVHVGDFGYHFDNDFLDDMYGLLAVEDIDLFFVDGNHENFPRLYSFDLNRDGVRELRYNIFHLPRGFRWEWHGVTYMALGGAHSVDRQGRRENVSWWPQERITAADEYRALDGGPVDVMFTHDCPYGVDIPGINDDTSTWIPKVDLSMAKIHRQTLRNIVDQVKPTELYHGHYHTKYDSVLVGSNYRTEIHGLDMDRTPFRFNMIIKELVHEPQDTEEEPDV